MNFSVNSAKVQGLKSEICLTPFSDYSYTLQSVLQGSLSAVISYYLL